MFEIFEEGIKDAILSKLKLDVINFIMQEVFELNTHKELELIDISVES